MVSTYRQLIASLSFAAAAVCGPSALAQGGPSSFEAAEAAFMFNHPSGCTIVLMSVTASRTNPGQSEHLDLSLFQDPGVTCESGANPNFHLASGGTDEISFSITSRLTEASVTASVPMTLMSTGDTATFQVSMSWAGLVGQLTPQMGRTTIPDPSVQSGSRIFHQHGYIRPATPSGTIHDGIGSYSTEFPINGQLSSFKQFMSGPQPRQFR
jgi:hypothetical protein